MAFINNIIMMLLLHEKNEITCNLTHTHMHAPVHDST